MKKQKSLIVEIIKRVFIKETQVDVNGKQIKGFTVFGWVLIIGAVVCGLCALEAAGVIDDLVEAFGKKPAPHGEHR
jgi:sugar phosphate permease